MGIRGDKQARAAVNQFKKWHTHKLSQRGEERFEWNLTTSPLSVIRHDCPNSLMYFLIQILLRMLHHFWPTAQREQYVKECAKLNGKCPPSIIALLFFGHHHSIPAHLVVGIPDAKRQRLQYSEPARAAGTACSTAGSEASSSSRNAVSIQEDRSDFWQVFAENVMHHLVWPAVSKGRIRTAPVSHRRYPIWWIVGILPILDDPSVWFLYWLGGQRMARNSWYYVCDTLGSYDFSNYIPSQFFVQKTVQQFLEAAGYRKLSGPAGVSRVTADIRSGAVQSARREQTNYAMRCAYDALDQYVRLNLLSANCCWTTSSRSCFLLGEAFQFYRVTGDITQERLDPKVVVSELRLSLQYMVEKSLWPRWFFHPNLTVDGRMSEYYGAFEDFGNEYWEALVNLMNLPSVMPYLYSPAISNASGSADIGDRVHQTDVAGSQFQGNGIQHMLTHLVLQCAEEGLAALSSECPV